MKKLLLIGGGGHCRACIDVIRQVGKYQIIGIIDKPEKVGQQVDGVKVVASDENIDEWLSKTDECLITIGHIGRSDRRQLLYQKLRSANVSFAMIISPRAYVSETAVLSEGVIIMHDALVNSAATIGENCIINSKALIEHDVVIGSHVHISTRATINGMVQVGDNCFVGSHAMLFNNIVVGNNVVIGGGQMVTANLPDNATPTDII